MDKISALVDAVEAQIKETYNEEEVLLAWANILNIIYVLNSPYYIHPNNGRLTQNTLDLNDKRTIEAIRIACNAFEAKIEIDKESE